MNFLVYSKDGECSIRPDSSRCKDDGDFYVPDGMSAVACTPVIYARMSRAGKAITAEFVGRYYDAVGFGLLLYPDGSTICDRTSILPMPLYNPITMESEDNEFIVTRNGETLFSTGMQGIRDLVEEAIVKCSTNTSIRRADFIMAELSEKIPLCDAGSGRCRIKGAFCGNELFDNEVKF